MDDTDKLKLLFEDAGKMGLTFEPPNVNLGRHRFEPVTDKIIRYGLGAVKGTGQQAIEAIVAAREAGGPFTSLFDFCVRVDKSKLNKRTVEALIKAGAFDAIEINRAALIASVDRAFAFAAATLANANQGGLFDMDDSHGSSTQEPELVDTPMWGIKERLTLEKTAVGFYLSGHLFDEVRKEVRRFAKNDLSQAVDSREIVMFAGIVSDLRVINGQRGKLGLFRLDDGTGMVDARVSDALMQANKNLFKDDELIIAMGKVQTDRFGGGGLQMNITEAYSLATARCRYAKFLRLQLPLNATDAGLDFYKLFKDFPPLHETTEQGDVLHGLPIRVPIQVRTAAGGATVDLIMEKARFYPTDEALAYCQAQAAQAVVAYEE
jgi:DNA polymerase-3 subunit alpha